MAATPAKIITVFNEKGGSGKTTLSCQLAHTLGSRGFSVLLADLDSQRTSTSWSANADADAPFMATVWGGSAYGNKVINEISKFRDKYDLIIADCAPSVDQPSTWAMLLVSDLALIPTRLSPPDLEALKAAKRLAKRAWEEVGQSNQFPVRVVPNGVRLHLEEDKDYMKLLRADGDIPPLEETLGDRRVFQRSMLQGSSVHALANKKALADKKDVAVNEVEAIANRVLTLLKMGRSTLKKVVNA